MEWEPCVKASWPPVLDDIAHGLECPFILVARRHVAGSLAIARTLLQQDRDLGAQLCKFKRAGNKGNHGTSSSSGGAEAANRVHVRVCARFIDMSRDVEAKVAFNPIGIIVLCSLVNGE